MQLMQGKAIQTVVFYMFQAVALAAAADLMIRAFVSMADAPEAAEGPASASRPCDSLLSGNWHILALAFASGGLMHHPNFGSTAPLSL
mmetsp:Transcript_15524/g.35257  ORF Transcript_15524/g.35257 Transcript_15524/m.35257 type:complete len:88 (+) Transcript_15524:1-264(+)